MLSDLASYHPERRRPGAAHRSNRWLHRERQGSIGKLIYDQGLYNRLNATLNEVQGMVNMIANGKGTIGKLVASEELYNKANASVDKLDKIIDEIQQGKGTVGKLLKDPSLYDNANQTMAKLTPDGPM